MPVLREHFPKEVSDRIVDVLKLDVHANERMVLEATVAALRKKDEESDRERVEEMIGGYRANGLACVGREATRRALEMGQVDELVITAVPDTLASKKDKATTNGARRAQQRRKHRRRPDHPGAQHVGEDSLHRGPGAAGTGRRRRRVPQVQAMSKQNNVNPDYYKLAGRERPGKANPVKAKRAVDRSRGAGTLERTEENRGERSGGGSAGGRTAGGRTFRPPGRQT